ncbi:MAG: prolyl oligopeptidase family serine peptidase [Pseudomonadota bacterium]
MRFRLALLSLLLSATVPALAAALPGWLVEPPVSIVRVSAAGDRLLIARGSELRVLDVASARELSSLDLPGHVRDVRWAGSTAALARVVTSDEEQLVRVDLGPEPVIAELYAAERAGRDRIRIHGIYGQRLVFSSDAGRAFRPDLLTLEPGAARPERLATNPGRVFRWMVDDRGEPRVARAWRPAGDTLRYDWQQRTGNTWYTARSFRLDRASEAILRVDARGWLIARRDEHGSALFWYDPSDRAARPPVWAAEAVSIRSVADTLEAPLPGLIAVEADAPALIATGTDWRARLDALAAQFPGAGPRLTGQAGGRVLWRLAFANRPGEWAVQDASGNARSILAARNGFEPQDGIAREAFDFAARDGLRLNGYVTRKADSPASPGVLLVHGGPWARDRWDFNPEAHYLATLGYTVLQVNFRGSTGYGPAHLMAGRQAWDSGMLDDLVDTVAHAADRDWVAADRVCIMGSSFGGYAALMAAASRAETFRCAVSRAPVTDLVEHVRDIRADGNQRGYYEWRTMVGGNAELYAASPINGAAPRRPVLIGHGASDRVVDIDQSRRYARRFDQETQLLELAGAGHVLRSPEARGRWYLAVRDFLAGQLAP